MEPTTQEPRQETPDTDITRQDPSAEEETLNGPGKKKKKQRGALGTILRIVIAVVILVVGVFIILFIVAKASHFDSIGTMLQHMFTELGLMWQRINA